MLRYLATNADPIMVRYQTMIGMLVSGYQESILIFSLQSATQISKPS